MRKKRKKHLALLMAFVMILSTCIGAYAEVLTQDGTSGVIQSQEMPPENETESENFPEGNGPGSGAGLESGQPEEPGEPEELGEPEEPGEFEDPAPEPESETDLELGQPEEPEESEKSEEPEVLENPNDQEGISEPGIGDAGEVIDNNVESGPTELITSVDGVTIGISAGEGVLPGGTELSAHRLSFLEALDYIEAIEEDTGEKLEDYMVFDIKLLDEEGNEIQPDGSVTVTFSDVYFADDDIVVYHLEPIIGRGSFGINSIRPNGGGLKPDLHLGQANIKDQFRAKNMWATKHRNDVVFTTNHFSIYAVGTHATATYEFYDGSSKVDTQIVKNGEFLEEPETPDKQEGKKFIGWYVEGESEPIDFSGTIDVPESKIIRVDARFDDVYYVYFVYNGNIIKTKEVVPDETTDGTGIGLVVTEAGKAFSHWSEAVNGPAFDFDTLINKDTTLYAVLADRWKVTFNTQGGSQVLPMYIVDGEQLGTVEDTERVGYDFDGWYTGPNGEGIRYTKTSPTITGDITLYAKWNANTNTKYTVIYWQQNADDDGYSYVESAARTGTTDTVASYDSKNYTGFALNVVESNKEVLIKGDGTTIKNVYYDRRTWSLQFRQSGTQIVLKTFNDIKYGADTSPYWDPTSAAYPTYIWATTNNGNTYYSLAPKMPNSNLTVYGKTAGDTNYRFNYLEDVLGNPPIHPPFNFQGPSGLRSTIEDYVEFPGFTVKKPNNNWQENPELIDGIYQWKIKYTRNKYDLTFQKNDNTSDVTIENILYEADISGKALDGYVVGETTRYDGYYFQGWYDNEALGGEAYDFAGKTMPPNNLVLYAKWSPPVHCVKYYLTPDESGEYKTIENIPHGGTILEEDLEGKKTPEGLEEKDFLGWYWYVGSAFVPFDFDLPLESDCIVLYPVWDSLDYEVVYKANGATGTVPVDNLSYKLGAGANVKSPGALIPPEGKVFTGWKKEGSDKIYYPNDKITITGNIELKAQWGDIVAETSLTYTANGGVGDDVIKPLLNNETHTVISNPFSREGYDFVHWNTKADGTGDSFDPEDEDNNKVIVDILGEQPNKLYAIWKIKTYTITYTAEANGSISGTTPQTVNHGGSTTSVTAVPDEGYRFVKWEEDNNENATRQETNVKANATYTAIFESNTYTLTYKDSMSTEIYDVETYEFGELVTAIADPAKSGYTFAGWEPAVPETMPAGDLTVYAQWSVNAYTLTYADSLSSEIYGTQTYDFGDTVTAIADPAKSGYTFAGWEPAVPETMPAGDLIVYAQWSVNAYTLTYADSLSSEIYGTQTYDFGDTVTAIADPAKSGYTFAGWEPAVPETMPAGDLTVYAQWSVNAYTLTYADSLSSEIYGTQTYDFGDTVTAIADPAKSGYTFAGWEPAVPETMPAGDLIVYAQWSVNAYTLTYADSLSSEIYGTQTYDFGDTVTAIADPAKSGYTFAGWEPAVPETMPAGDLTVYAQWSVNAYTLTYADSLSSEIYGTQTYDFGDTVTAIADPAKSGYTFAGWEPAVPETMPAGDLIVYAQWSVNAYTLTYADSLSSEIYGTQTYDFGDTVTAIADPAKSGYTFAGWEPAVPETMPAGDLTVYAQWSVNAYTLTYADSLSSEIYGTQTYDFGDTVTAIADPAKSGYTFAGWEPAVPETMPAGDLIVYAQWSVNAYTLTYADSLSSEIYGTQTYDFGDTVTAIADPAKSGYTFAGWEPAVPETMPAGDLTVYAQWSVNAYTLTYADSLSSEIYGTQTYDFGDTVTAIADPAKSGYTFAGWEPAVPETMPAGDLTVYAQWSVNAYTLTYADSLSSEIYGTQTYDFGDTVTAIADPAKSGYTFAGWEPAVPETMPAGDLIVYAQWSVNAYTLTYADSLSSEIYGTQTYDFGDTVTAIADPAKSGYTFAGWEPAVPETMPAGDLTVYAQWVGLKVEKSADKDNFSELGEKITYTYKVTNIGNVTVDGPFSVVDDRIGTIDSSTVPESLAPDEDFTITAVYEVTQADLDAGFVTNVVSVTGGDEDLPPAEDEETVEGDQDPELSVAKSADRETFSAAGDVITYTYKVTNTGNVTIQGPFTVEDDKIDTIDTTNAPASLAPGKSFTVEAEYTVTQADMDAGFVTNVVSVIGGDEDLPPGEDEETVYGDQDPKLSVSKLASRTTYTGAGQKITYTITVKNTGNVTLTGIEVIDSLISDLDGPDGDKNENGKLDIGETWTYTGTYETTREDVKADSIVNTATVETKETDKQTASVTIRYSSGGGGGDDSGGGKDKDKDKDEEIIIPPEPPALEKDEHFAYVIGYPDNTVRPQGNITREEVAAVFYRLLESGTRDRLKATVSDFPDVETNRWSSYHIATLANGNIISGYPDGTFRPGNYITRAEIATIASKFDKLTPLEIDMFSDVSGHWAEEFINSAAQKGWVTGYPDGTFKPDQYITRAEFVTLVNNVLERRVKAEDILPEARQFPDLDKDAWYYEAMQEAINSHDYIRKPDGYEEWTEIYYPDLDM